MDIRDLPEEVRYAWGRKPWASRKAWVWVGDIAQWLCALGALWYIWPRGFTPASCAAALAACAAAQAIAVGAVVWPGRAAGSAGLMDHHQGVTVAITCATWVVAVCPGLPILYKTLENPRRPTEALFVAGNALLLTSIAGLVAVTALSAHVTKGSPHELPDEPDWVDVVDAGTGDD